METREERWVLILFMGCDPPSGEPERSGDSSSLETEGSVIVTVGSWGNTSLSDSSSGGEGGYGALCLDNRIPFRISLKNPSPP